MPIFADADQQRTLDKVIDNINAARQADLVRVYTDKQLLGELARQRDSGEFAHGSKSKVYRKVASVPVEAWKFLEAQYGKDFWKERGFFVKHAPEWSTLARKDL